MDGPLQIIANNLPLGPDEWVSDRAECAAGILEALSKAGWVVMPLSVAHEASRNSKMRASEEARLRSWWNWFRYRLWLEPVYAGSIWDTDCTCEHRLPGRAIVHGAWMPICRKCGSLK